MSSHLLQRELETYRANLPELRVWEGWFALIKGGVITVFETQDEAVERGHELYGLDRFMVKQIREIEEPLYCPDRRPMPLDPPE